MALISSILRAFLKLKFSEASLSRSKKKSKYILFSLKKHTFDTFLCLRLVRNLYKAEVWLIFSVYGFKFYI